MMFNYQEGSPTYRSAWGACFSLFFIILTLSYTIEQILTLHYYKGTSITTSVMHDNLDESAVFTHEDELMVAFGVLDFRTSDYYDPLGRPLDYFFTLEATQELFDFGKITYSSLDVHACTESELENFYPVKENEARAWQLVKVHLYCFDMNKFAIQGGKFSPIYQRPHI